MPSALLEDSGHVTSHDPEKHKAASRHAAPLWRFAQWAYLSGTTQQRSTSLSHVPHFLNKRCWGGLPVLLASSSGKSSTWIQMLEWQRNRSTRGVKPLPQHQLVQHMSHVDWPGIEPRCSMVPDQRLTPLSHGTVNVYTRMLPQYSATQFLSDKEQNPFNLRRPTGYCCLGKYTLLRNTYI
jgi:hypothetical protein